MDSKNKLKKFLDYQKEYKEISERSDLRFNRSERMLETEAYIKCCESTKVDRNIILYESYWGRGMVDGPFALFKALLNDARFTGAKHVWVVDDLQKRDFKTEQYRGKNNVLFIERHSEEYLNYLAKAGILINNVTFPALFIKRPEQICINTWHGTPLKKMGYSMEGGNFGSRNVVRNFLHTDYLIASNHILENMYLNDYKLDGIMPGKIIKEGYPRIYLLFNTDREVMLDELEYYGVDIDREKKIILYAPTWRQNDRQDIVVDVDELISFKESLEEQIDTDKYQVLIKPHQHLYEKVKDDKKYQGKLIPTSVDANELLSVVDILISDYSSIFFDYMATDRPILFYITDLEDYSEARGLSMSVGKLPGPVGESVEEIAGYIGNIENVSEEHRDRYEELKKEMCPLDDGRVSERVIDCIAGNEDKYNIITANNYRKKLLLSIGMLRENGITNSALSLLKQIDYDEFDVTLYAAIDYSNDNIIKRVNKDVDPHVRVMIKIGSRAEARKEASNRIFFEKHPELGNSKRKLITEKAMRREFRRAFGDTEFDYVVDFGGYGVYNALLMLQSGNARKSIWMHSDIKADMNRTVNGEKPLYSVLSYCISLYPRYDAIVSCGKTVMEVNRKNLSVPKTREKFTWAKNTTNADRVRKLIDEATVSYDGNEYIVKSKTEFDDRPSRLSLIKAPKAGTTNFVTMGRISTEKNHHDLVKAFGRYNKKYPDSRLYIIGTGPLHEEIEDLIAQEGLKEKVIITGNMYNPFALMKRCDCFVLPSFHEGMPMVLLEARQCGLPIIVSDFSTVNDSLFPNGQLVIHSNEDSIYEGLCAFSEGKVPQCSFDVDEYNREAYREFRRAITGQEA